MNNVYFACMDCKTFIDAGYRWCYWALEKPGIVQRKKSVSVEKVLKAEEYWDLEDSSRLEQALTNVRRFLLDHQSHSLLYGDQEEFMGLDAYDDYSFLDWSQVNGHERFFTPRDFVERLGLRTWEAVEAYTQNKGTRPIWWYEAKTIGEAKKKFLKIISQ